MATEVKIERLREKRQKPKEIREQARKCMEDRVELRNINDNLSNQMFEDAPTLYLNPTERMYISNLVVPGDTFATVLGSGDFALEASFHGVNNILTFDINKHQYYPAALKLKGLQNMGYDEYYKFFSDPSSPLFLSKEVYERLKSSSEIDYDLYAFMDEVIKLKEKEQIYTEDFVKKVNRSMPGAASILNDANIEELDQVLQQFQEYRPSSVLRTIAGTAGFKTEGTYLENETSYKKAQDSIISTHISHVKTDVTKLKDYLDKIKYTKKNNFNGFNAIYLSNVPEYIPGNEFANAVKTQLIPLLSEKGVIAYCVQGTSVKTLNMPRNAIDVIEQNQEFIKTHEFNRLAGRQMLNAARGVNILKEQYDVSFIEKDTLSLANGLDDKDTYVHIRKK